MFSSIQKPLSKSEGKILEVMYKTSEKRTRELCEQDGYSVEETEKRIAERYAEIPEEFERIRVQMLGLSRISRMLEKRYGQKFADSVWKIESSTVTGQEITNLVIVLQQKFNSALPLQEDIQALLQPFIERNSEHRAQKFKEAKRETEIARQEKLAAIREAVEEKLAADAAIREAVEEKLAADAAIREAIEEKLAADAAIREAIEEKLAADAAKLRLKGFLQELAEIKAKKLNQEVIGPQNNRFEDLQSAEGMSDITPSDNKSHNISDEKSLLLSGVAQKRKSPEPPTNVKTIEFPIGTPPKKLK